MGDSKMTDASTIDAVQPKARRLSFKELPGFDISAEALLGNAVNLLMTILICSHSILVTSG
ncbi:TPA: hypothetical protein R4S27_005007 [Citrobacter freundii]|nr:hypothetical protein [Citrobacter freundii]